MTNTAYAHEIRRARYAAHHRLTYRMPRTVTAVQRAELERQFYAHVAAVRVAS